MLDHGTYMDFNEAIFANDHDAIRRLLDQFPDAVHHVEERSGFPTFLHSVAKDGMLDLVRLFVERGSDINIHREGVFSPIGQAILSGNVECVKYLLAKGANVAIGQPLISAIQRPPPDDMEIVKLLVEHGALVNECYHVYDDKKLAQLNPLWWAVGLEKTAIADYLRSCGATMPPG
jgi:ankyrin repeat protein